MSSISESFFLDKQKNPFILSLWLNNFSKYFRQSFLAWAQVPTPKGHTLNRIPNQQGEETSNNVLVKSFWSSQEENTRKIFIRLQSIRRFFIWILLYGNSQPFGYTALAYCFLISDHWHLKCEDSTLLKTSSLVDCCSF